MRRSCDFLVSLTKVEGAEYDLCLISGSFICMVVCAASSFVMKEMDGSTVVFEFAFMLVGWY